MPPNVRALLYTAPKLTEERRSVVLMALLLLMVVGTATIIALILILAVRATRSELVALFGPAAGALFAALAAIVAIEWQTNRRETTAKRIVTDLLEDAIRHWATYAEWIDDMGAAKDRRAAAGTSLRACIDSVRAAGVVARELQTSTPGMARLVLALEYEAGNLSYAEAESQKPSGDIAHESCKTAIGEAITTAMFWRTALIGAREMERIDLWA